MARTEAVDQDHSPKLKEKVKYQSCRRARIPRTRTPRRSEQNDRLVEPGRRRTRVLLACHYDTRPQPTRPNEQLPAGKVPGSQRRRQRRAMFMEWGHHLRAPRCKPPYGARFLFFDGKSRLYQPIDVFLARRLWKEYRDMLPQYRYVCGVLVDMIGDKRFGAL